MTGPAVFVRSFAGLIATLAAGLAAFNHDVLQAAFQFLVALLAAMAARTAFALIVFAIAVSLGDVLLRIEAPFGFSAWLLVMLVWLLAWLSVALLSEAHCRAMRWAVALRF
ncbi:MAG: hypothetical protein ACJASV_002259 [Pseudorhodobacter sp.]|jgi:hypothetical protein